MNTATVTPATLETVTLRELEDGPALEDGAIIGAARDARVGRVAGTGRSALQSAESRAWTMAGNVD